MNKLKFNASNAKEYFSMQLEYYKTCQEEIFKRDNKDRDIDNFVYSAEYQRYVGMENAMREVLDYFSKFEL